jgi:hypothetical protein
MLKGAHLIITQTNTQALSFYMLAFQKATPYKRGSKEGGSHKRVTRGMEELKQEECMCLGDVSL